MSYFYSYRTMQESTASSDTECENWDEDCVVANIPLDNEKHITGFHLIPTCEPNPEPPIKQMKTSIELSQHLLSTQFIDNFQVNWKNNIEFKEKDVELIADPFKVCVVKNFLDNETIIPKVIEEFNEIEWNKRSLDLYEFFQSADLKDVNLKNVNIIYDFLKTTVKDWIQNVTGLELTNISATCSLYADTDYLLLHDDQQEDRMVAFVYYFTSPRAWKESNGGALQLFSKDDTGQPLAPVRDILPSNNQFIFFQVANDSYHKVSEVMNKNDCRMSINGWFHTKVPPVFKVIPYTPLVDGLFGTELIDPQVLDLDLEHWIHSEYLDCRTAKYIQKHVEEQSEISLHNYFIPEVFKKVFKDLQCKSIKWTPAGPPNRCCYEVASKEDLPEMLQKFISLFCSFQIFHLLKQYTDLDLISLRYELQRWTPGCYSLLTDHDWSKKNELDLVLYLGCPNSTSVSGGQIMYVSTEEEVQQALITLSPEENNLNVVYRDTARISKHMSKYSACPLYYLLICSYSE